MSGGSAWPSRRFGRRHFAVVAAQGDAYPLDDIARWLSDGEPPACDKNTIVAYRGTTICERAQGLSP